MGSISFENPLWQEISPGRFERPIDAPEKLTKAFADQGEPIGKTSVLLTCIVDYATQNPNIVEIFRQAWSYMRAEYPHIASHIIGEKRIYDAHEEATKGHESFIVVQDKPIEEVFAGLGKLTGSLFYLFPEAKKIMTVTGHDFSDGRGHLCFFDKFFSAVEAIETGHPPEAAGVDVLQALAPAYDAIARPNVPTEAYQEAQASLGLMAQNLGNGLPGHNLDQISTGKARWQGVQFSEAETSAVLRAVKARGTTLTPIVHTAVVVARNRITGSNLPYTATIPADCRRYTGKYATQPFVSYLIGGIPTIETGDFDLTAKNFRKAYDQVRPDLESGRYTAIAETCYEFMKSTKGQCPPQPAKTSPDLSNPGKADDFLKPFYGSIEVRRVALQCRELFQMPFMVFLSFRGRFRASITYNDYHHTEDEIAAYARMFKSVLFEGLGLAMEVDALETSL